MNESSPKSAPRVFMQSECVYDTCRVGKVACKMEMAICMFYRLFAVDPSSRHVVFTVNCLCLGKRAHAQAHACFLSPCCGFEEGLPH